MRFLVVGAGAIGGYFGGRLLEAGCDVTFLVRPTRAERLATTGLTITSPAGNLTLRSPPTILAAELRAPFNVVILSCKAYDLDSAIESFTPAVGPDTAVVPLLNGMRHLEVLDARFGADRVLGGSCFISAKLEEGGRIDHVSDIHRLTFGERAGGRSPRVEAIAAAGIPVLHPSRLRFAWGTGPLCCHPRDLRPDGGVLHRDVGPPDPRRHRREQTARPGSSGVVDGRVGRATAVRPGGNRGSSAGL